jgi:hypothetical protein
VAGPKLVQAQTREQLIDEFGALDRELQEFAPKQKRYKQLQDTIRSWYEDFPAERPDTLTGAHYIIQVGARTKERFFSLKTKAKIFTMLGKAKAVELFSITLKAVEEALGKPALEELVSEAYSGSRKLVAVPKAPAKTAA